MASDAVEEASRKRKRSQKSRQGPSSTRKRIRADGSDSEVDAEEVVYGVKSGAQDPTDTAADFASRQHKNATTLLPSHSHSPRNKSESASASTVTQMATTKSRKDRESTWAIKKTIGGRYVAQDPQFTHDGRYLVAAKEYEVRLLSLEDSLPQSSIPLADTSAVTAFAVSAQTSQYVYVGLSNPNSVQLWDWENSAQPLKTADIDGKIVQIAVLKAANPGKEDVYVLCQGEGGSQIIRNATPTFTSKALFTELCVVDDVVVAVGSGKLAVGLAAENAKLVEWDLGLKITTLAVRKQQPANPKNKHTTLNIGVGISTGEVLLYESVVVSDKASSAPLSTPRILHWHREAVRSLKWSKDGNYLISGGRETVLVIWQLATGRKQFLPHLSAEIERITVSPGGSNYALQLGDNSIMVLSTTELQPTAHFPDVQAQLPSNRSPTNGKSATPGNEELSVHGFRMAGAIHPKGQDSVLLAVPSSVSSSPSSLARPFLQSFSLSTQRHQYRQAMTRNTLTDLNTGPNGLPIQSPDVNLLALSHDGGIMATVETWAPLRDDFSFLAHDEKLNYAASQSRQEVYLKFWRWDVSHSQWSLQSRISDPHALESSSAGFVLELISDPTSHRFFTLGSNSTIRSWTSKSTEDWVSRHSVTLTTPTPLNIPTDGFPLTQSSALCISLDASLLAVSLPASSHSQSTSQIHLLTAPTLQQICVLPPSTGQIHALSFTPRHLISLSTTSLSVIDIPTLSTISTHRLFTPSPSIPLSTRRRHLAITADGYATVSLATRGEDRRNDGPYTRIEVYSVGEAHGKGRRVFETKIRGIVTGLLPRGREVIVVLGDGRILTLSPPGDARGIMERIGTGARTVDEGEERGIVIDDTEARPAQGTDDAETGKRGGDVDMLDEGGKGDRPVVRPEELAQIFERGAVVGVREMFEGVVGLFARRPVRAN